MLTAYTLLFLLRITRAIPISIYNDIRELDWVDKDVWTDFKRDSREK